jgi:hypothetical protein
MAIFVGNTGVNRKVADGKCMSTGLNWRKCLSSLCCTLSVAIPNVPPAPMNNFAMSKPAPDFLALGLVLMTCLFGSKPGIQTRCLAFRIGHPNQILTRF